MVSKERPRLSKYINIGIKDLFDFLLKCGTQKIRLDCFLRRYHAVTTNNDFRSDTDVISGFSLQLSILSVRIYTYMNVINMLAFSCFLSRLSEQNAYCPWYYCQPQHSTVMVHAPLWSVCRKCNHIDDTIWMICGLKFGSHFSPCHKSVFTVR